MLEELFINDRRLRIDHKKLLKSNFVDLTIIESINHYLSDYATYNNLTNDNILKSYNNFLQEYSKDIENFLSTGKYPYLMADYCSINRIDYDIALILSTIVTAHRHQIMCKLTKYSTSIKGNVLIIGLGSGIELELLNCLGLNISIDAYDINITEFVKNRFKKVFNIVEKEFKGNDAFYDHIIAIELLEHLENPYHFLSMCFNSLNEEGTLVTTTATDVPQFDHLYNFNDDNIFNHNIGDIGYFVSEKEDISHNNMQKNMNAKNTWYVLNKTQEK